MRHAEARFGGGNKPKLPLPKPPPPNPLAHNRQPKVRFTVADDAPTVNSGGSSYQIPGSTPHSPLAQEVCLTADCITAPQPESSHHRASVNIGWRLHARLEAYMQRPEGDEG